ncbi:solute carrier family 25 member 3-like [Dama dama]|uniref:solute carrier family 25 member 3-like n=1 Tax=Dama dama TaxID=30532 RepID=UPI002A3596A3|nr:solute carrier family 25 member 3-like [Dama dama]
MVEEYTCEYGSVKFYALCGFGGVLSCGLYAGGPTEALMDFQLHSKRMVSVVWPKDGPQPSLATPCRGSASLAFMKYTMMKFACPERTVEALYKFVVPKPRSECSKPEQLVVTFVAGYIAGVFCAIVSHPANSMVSVLNKEKGSSASQVLKRLAFKGVWKGLSACIIMIGTLTALQWFKVYFRLPRPPPPEMPESLKKKLGYTQ